MSAADYSLDYHSEAIRRLLDVLSAARLLGADPAAGSEAIVTVPGGEYWSLVSLMVTLTTSAVVANRRTTLVVDDGTNEVVRIGSNANVAASAAVRNTFKSGGVFNQSTVTGIHNLIGFGELVLQPGWRLRTVTDNLDAGDDYSAPILQVRRYAPDTLRSLSRLIGGELDRFTFALPAPS